MNKITHYMLIFAAGLLAFHGPAFGVETVHGQVTSVNPADNTVTIDRVQPDGTIEQNVRLQVAEDAQLEGVTSLEELQVGDQIRAEAEDRFFGPMEARSLSVVEGEGFEAGFGEEPMGAEEEQMGTEEEQMGTEEEAWF